MKEKNNEIIYEILEYASNITEFNILDIMVDSISGIKIIVNTFNCISDKIFCNKIENFVRMANKFKSDKSFDKFKQKISEDEEFKNKVSTYLLYKINKFDANYKLKIFSKACVDFFNSNIDENTLTEISEVIDNLTLNDIKFIKYIYNIKNELISIQKIIDENLFMADEFKIYSSILKLINFGLIEEELGYTHESLGNKLKKRVKLSSFGCILYKYL